ncbi:MAG: alpha/beta hydrolase [Bacteroidales bacterium]|nr:alpha/beta hydrolase [Bacteroidales bacterium]
MKRLLSITLFLAVAISAAAQGIARQREYIWPKNKMPDASDRQIAAMTSETSQPKFNPDKFRKPYLDWFDAPENPSGTCMILISGGAYNSTCDVSLIDLWNKELSARGVQCVNFVYRTPRPEGLPYYMTAWEDGQRAVRLVRSQAAKRGFDPDKIGVVGMSAGGHLSLLLAANSLTPAYERIDKVDDIPCNVNIAIVNAPAYITSDADEFGTPATREGYGADVTLSSLFKFDGKTCPMSLHHGGIDIYSPNGSTLVYRKLRSMGIPAELHLYPNKNHGAYGFDRALEFLTQMGFLGPLEPEVTLVDRFTSDEDRAEYSKEDIWPEGKTPDFQENQCVPYIEWHIPAVRKTDAIQIIYSGGSYIGNNTEGFEVAPARRYLNAMGITVVTLKYRTPRPAAPLAKHTTAWQDLQRAIRIVRSEAAEKGLDPNKIGIMGSSAGGHLTLMGVTSSRHNSYAGIDEIDKLPCNVQWGIGIYPAYALTDGGDKYNTTGGNDDSATLVPEFSFDLDTAPMLLIHGDADRWAAMNSVKVWEKMRSMGIQSELHTLALRDHCFQRNASPGTGSYTWLDRIGEYLTNILNL